MANEAVIVELLGNGGDPIDITVADGTGIEKGTILSGVDARGGEATSTAGEYPVGITAAEKVASDGSTNVACYTHGIFDLKTSTALTPGQAVMMSGANIISGAGTAIGQAFGRCLEEGAIDETVEVLVNI